MSEGHSPVEQFAITKIFDINIFGMDLSFTNSALAMTIALSIVSVIMYLGTRKTDIKPRNMQCIVEGLYLTVTRIMKNNISDCHSDKHYTPIIFSIFTFILFCNLFGLLPYAFTPTSHVAVTLSLSTIVVVIVFTIGIIKNGLKFFHSFVPEGTPWWLAPAMLVIEFFAYLIRPLTLAVRLAANMIAGHTVLKVVAGFVLGMHYFGVVPISFIAVLTAFEIFIACLQAYIFTFLSALFIASVQHRH